MCLHPCMHCIQCLKQNNIHNRTCLSTMVSWHYIYYHVADTTALTFTLLFPNSCVLFEFLLSLVCQKNENFHQKIGADATMTQNSIFFRISFLTKSEIPISSSKFGDFSKKQTNWELNWTLFHSFIILNWTSLNIFSVRKWNNVYHTVYFSFSLFGEIYLTKRSAWWMGRHDIYSKLLYISKWIPKITLGILWCLLKSFPLLPNVARNSPI